MHKFFLAARAPQKRSQIALFLNCCNASSIRAKALSRTGFPGAVRWAPPRRQKVEDQNSGKRILNHSAVDESFHYPLFGRARFDL